MAILIAYSGTSHSLDQGLDKSLDQGLDQTNQATDLDATKISDSSTVRPAITGADAPHPNSKTLVEVANSKLAPLPIEETGRVETLPMSYPETWVMIDEASFF